MVVLTILSDWLLKSKSSHMNFVCDTLNSFLTVSPCSWEKYWGSIFYASDSNLGLLYCGNT
jgi:hypothetical protein